MSVPIPMPHLGVSVTEGTVLRWHKSPGDPVEADEVVCEIATDKLDTEVTSPSAGVLAEIVAQVGDTVPVGEPLATLNHPQEGVRPLPECGDGKPANSDPAIPTSVEGSDPSTELGSAFALNTPVPARARDGGPVSSPVARRLAAAHGIELRSVSGTGMRGRIRRADVEAAIATRPAAGGAAGGAPKGYDGVPSVVVPLTRTRRVMAEHMIRSRQTAAHMTTEADVDMSAAQRARTVLNQGRETRLTPLALISRVAVAALADFPDLNASFDGETLRRFTTVNLGIAVDTPDGLVVPVMKGADKLTAPAIADRIADLAAKARGAGGGLRPDDLAQGTFTISNPGSVGGISAMAIINQPQVAILGTPAIVKTPIVVTDEHGDDAVAIRPVMRLALTFDHRVIDGAYATRAVVAMKQRLETWDAGDYA